MTKPATAYELRCEHAAGRVLQYIIEKHKDLRVETLTDAEPSSSGQPRRQYLLPLIFGEQEYVCTLARTDRGASMSLQERGARVPLLTTDCVQALWALEDVEDDLLRRANPRQKRGLAGASPEARLSYLESMLGYVATAD